MLTAIRVTNLGEILPFGPLLGYFLGENLFCCRYYKSSGQVGCRCFELLNLALIKIF
jgi:hypothetical protein